VNGTDDEKIYTFLDVDIPADVGEGAQILRAELMLHKGETWVAGDKTLIVNVITSPWDAETVTYDTVPSVGAYVSTTVEGAGVAGDLVTLNVTPLVQAAVASRDAGVEGFFGFRLSTDSEDDLVFSSAYVTPDARPILKVEVSVPPNAPEDLLPNGGRAVSETQPLLDSRFRDADAEDIVSAGQWRISLTETMDDLVYDSGEVDVTSAQFDLDDPPAGAPATPTLSGGIIYYWDVRLRDNHGLWSDWSSVASFEVVAKGTLVLTSPATSSVSSPTPMFEATFTPDDAETLRSIEWDLEVFRDGLWRSHWLSRRTVSSATSVTLPDAYALREGESYRLTVRAWDDVDREDMAGDRNFLSATQQFTLEEVSV
jgi:hypothetical protein